MVEDTIKDDGYVPITQELRETVIRNSNLSAYGLEQLALVCDAVDSIHKALEDEYAEMQEFCDRLKDAVNKREDVTLFGVDYMALHEDADGVATHVGDKIDRDDGETVNVIGVSRYGAFYYSDTEHRIKHIHSADLHHHHEPTVADLLREFAQAMAEHSDLYVSDAIDAYERDAADEEAIEHYAKRLQLAEVMPNE